MARAVQQRPSAHNDTAGRPTSRALRSLGAAQPGGAGRSTPTCVFRWVPPATPRPRCGGRPGSVKDRGRCAGDAGHTGHRLHTQRRALRISRTSRRHVTAPPGRSRCASVIRWAEEMHLAAQSHTSSSCSETWPTRSSQSRTACNRSGPSLQRPMPESGIPSDHPRLATSRFAAKDNRSPDAPRSVGSDRGDNDWVDPCQELLAPLEPTRMMRNIPGADDAAIGEVRRVAPVAGGKRRESAGRRRAGRTAVVTDVATGSPIRARSPFRARARRQVRPSRGPACGWWVVGWRRRGR